MTNKEYIRLLGEFLQNKDSQQDKKSLANFLRKDRQIHSVFEKSWQSASPSIEERTANRMYESIREAVHSTEQKKTVKEVWRKMLRGAAIFILPVLSALSVYYFLTSDKKIKNLPVVIAAANGEKAEVTLSDGTKVWINSGSVLTYDHLFNSKERHVRLTGEAYFEVAKDPERPFIVTAGDMDIQALGTAFNVNAYSDDNSASSVLVEGRIEIQVWGQKKILAENERVTIDKRSRTISIDRIYASDFVQWKSGNLYFENCSFEEIANTLSRVFNVEIRFVSEELRTVRFTGTLGSSSIRNTLDILSLTSAMRYKMNGTVIELYCKK